ncbi:DUF4190 domain-containing protein [Polyangium aurulentum]|uniref:DUF4190 domain-containing protein n=1 Tax=Polyangium aurulentum TaxID=2567896 RepID=UPI0010AE1F42|nr:DUF4190 domain-containing protein [Polyangium aurulentum]UQA58760.1 DUF4190 domain-containing protein [Polyangium aurulentum]
MSDVFQPRSVPHGNGEGRGLGPLDDPYLVPAEVPRRATLSPLALTSILAPILGGPLGSVAAIVFGWAARREIREAKGPRRGYAMATVGMALGLCLTIAWGAAIALNIWSSKYQAEHRVTAETGLSMTASDPRATPAGPVDTTPETDSGTSALPSANVPRETALKHEGLVTVVDVGAQVTSLSQELARQRADASTVGETVLVMTTRDQCQPCQRISDSLRDPLMQTALAKVRLVRVDIDVFKEDLDALKMPYKRYPSFFLLALDLFPRDAIDGGEWDEDVPQNIAPVLGAFVRGKYDSRREAWQPIPGTGIRL